MTCPDYPNQTGPGRAVCRPSLMLCLQEGKPGGTQSEIAKGLKSVALRQAGWKTEVSISLVGGQHPVSQEELQDGSSKPHDLRDTQVEAGDV